MGAGKSTAIETLKSQSAGKAVCLLKFAHFLYQIQEFAYRLISPVYKPPADFEKDRYLLQVLGTDWGRDRISPNLWVDLWKARATQLCARDADVTVVADDVRFDNEAEAIQALGGYVVRIESSRGADRITTNNGVQKHASEAGIDPELIDYTVNNDGTIEEFQASLKALFEQIRADKAA